MWWDDRMLWNQPVDAVNLAVSEGYCRAFSWALPTMSTHHEPYHEINISYPCSYSQFTKHGNGISNPIGSDDSSEQFFIAGYNHYLDEGIFVIVLKVNRAEQTSVGMSMTLLYHVCRAI